MKRIVAMLVVCVSVMTGSAAKEMPIYSVETPVRAVALTFNAAYSDAGVADILATLERRGITASFFLCGQFVNNHPGLVKQIFAAGHDVGNHGDTHAHVASLSLAQNKKEIGDMHKKVNDLLGFSMTFFRPPYGEYNNTVMAAAKDLGYTSIQWDVDSLDWKKDLSAWQVISRVLDNKKLRNGSIVLFHTDGQHTPAVLDKIIDGLIGKGFQFMPVSELVHKNGYYLDIEGRQRLNEKDVSKEKPPQRQAAARFRGMVRRRTGASG